MSYAFRCRSHSGGINRKTYWLSNHMQNGYGVTCLRSEAWTGTLDEAEKMKPSLRITLASGTTVRFSELWEWEMVTAGRSTADIREGLERIASTLRAHAKEGNATIGCMNDMERAAAELAEIANNLNEGITP